MWFPSFYCQKMGPKMTILQFIFSKKKANKGIHENYGSINCKTHLDRKQIIIDNLYLVYKEKSLARMDGTSR